MKFLIACVELRYQQDVLFVMKVGMKYAKLAGLGSQSSTKFVTALSELCRNALQYAHGGQVGLCVEQSADNQWAFGAEIIDQGLGIRNLEQVLDGSYVSSSGMGLGLRGARKLVDIFEIQTSEKGTEVKIGVHIKDNPNNIDRASVEKWVQMLEVERNISPLQELKKQNKRLVEAYEIIQKKEESVQKANQQMKQLILKLEQKNEELRDFAHVVSHDLKSPLNVIFMASEMISSFHMDTLDSEAQEMFRMIFDSATKMRKLINDMLEYATSSVHEDKREDIALDDLVYEVIDLIALPPNATVKVNCNTHLSFDRIALQQVIQNLLTNAIKYADKPQILVEVSCVNYKGKELIITVKDNGPGIREEDMENIFKLFHTLNQRSNMESGTGIGLPLVKRIAERNNGKVWVESEVGVGSTFFFSIPLAPWQAEC